jgi:hypothetical protein
VNPKGSCWGGTWASVFGCSLTHQG